MMVKQKIKSLVDQKNTNETASKTTGHLLEQMDTQSNAMAFLVDTTIEK